MFCVTVVKTVIPDAMKSLLENCTHNLLFKEYLVNDLSIFKNRLQDNHIVLKCKKYIICYSFMWKTVKSVLQAEWNNRI